MGSVVWLPSSAEVRVDRTLGGSEHPNREPFDQALNDPAGEHAWDVLRDDYRQQSVAWREWTRSQPDYVVPVVAALEHLATTGIGQVRDGVVLEVGAGTGEASGLLAGAFDFVVVSDVVLEMVRQVEGQRRRLALDVQHLPFMDSSVRVIVGLNAVPHAGEFDRVLAPDGCVVWCSSFGPHTPLYVSPEVLCRQLGPQWGGVAAREAAGDWCVLSRGEA